MAMANMGRALAASLLGSLKVYFGWQYAILAVGVLSLASLFFILLLRLKKHLDRLSCIEADEVERDYPKIALVIENKGRINWRSQKIELRKNK